MNEVIHIKNIHQLHRLAGLRPPKNPLLTIQRIEHLSLSKGIFPEKLTYGFYSLGLKKNLKGYIKYGRTSYDFQEGALGFKSPLQVVEFMADIFDGGEGWVLFFSKALIAKTELEKNLVDYGFFDYRVSEGLHLSYEEEQKMNELFLNIEKELNQSIDNYSNEIIVANLALLLKYAKRFYARQFITRQDYDSDILTRFEHELRRFYHQDAIHYLPSVNHFANILNMSPNYLSDLLKSQTGKSALEHIHYFILDLAKNRLMTHANVSEVAYSLGFEYPQYFTRFFKQKMGITPKQYRNTKY